MIIKTLPSDKLNINNNEHMRSKKYLISGGADQAPAQAPAPAPAPAPAQAPAPNPAPTQRSNGPQSHKLNVSDCYCELNSTGNLNNCDCQVNYHTV